ncbi:DUF1801 domain-containing protein [Muricauda sp. SCSIO 64092]|uniref:DUF1801 domain-containing protein n=1 Tax=Allomuricauda sp. SCSIO 64092 TaxID=2908842 RepID=UPI001FF235A1|nr:DUF1801 domain-containing protein [Muricauda sp. SCSIO 64092]UOY08279.1 DUF1801 domain-containing protein [Muricauda sp. SCSIO 64092]
MAQYIFNFILLINELTTSRKIKPNPQLRKFMKPYDEEMQKLTLQLRDFITNLVPQANELIWDNYNAVALAYSKSEKLKDAFCHIALYSKYVNFGFNRGAELTKTNVKLNGKGKLIRHISVKDLQSFPKHEIEKMIWEAVGISENMNSELINPHHTPKSIVMSTSEKKTRPTKKPAAKCS